MSPILKYISAKTICKGFYITYHVSEYGVCLPYGNELNNYDIRYVYESFVTILESSCLRN